MFLDIRTEAYTKLSLLNKFMDVEARAYSKKNKKTVSIKEDIGKIINKFIEDNSVYSSHNYHYKYITERKAASIEKEFLKNSKIYFKVLDDEISDCCLKLDGEIKYTPMKTGSDEEFLERRSVPESSKGLRYKMDELHDLVMITHRKHEICQLKRDLCSSCITSIDNMVSEEKAIDITEEDSNKKAHMLLEERYNIQQEKNKYERLMNDFANQFIHKDYMRGDYRKIIRQKEFFLDEIKTFRAILNGITTNIRAYISSTNKNPTELNEILINGESLRYGGHTVFIDERKGYSDFALKNTEIMRTYMQRIHGIQGRS